MHRDTQIGLAMAIVLIGFAAALCFPRDGQVQQPLAELPNAAELDAAIARMPVRVYTPQLPEPTPTKGADAGPPSAATERHASSDESASAQEAAAERESATATVPPAIAAAASLPVSGEGPFSGEGGPSVIPSSTVPEATEAVRYHVIRPGDTLSGLAQRYLGSVARYPEIFEANRDQLESPNDLRLNMRLRIP